MEVAAGAMSPVIRKLGELLVGEYNIEKRVKKGVQSLLTELEMMHAVLRKVGEVPSDQLDEPVRIWAGKVRDLSCDMEDAIDDFAVRVDEGSSSKPTNMRNRVNKFIKKTTKLFGKGKALHQICDAIEEAKDLAKELAELHKRYELDMFSSTNGATIDPRVLALQKDVGELVGLDRTRDELIKTLISEEGSSKEQLKTISIVGVGGLGKTTLTKAVFEKIKAQFDCAAFVPVGQNPDIKKVFKDLLYGLNKGKFSDIHNTARDEKLLMEEISEFLVDKRYLVVIDDIWEEEIWRFINSALCKNKLHSRIITTTRNVSVSEACLSSSDDMIHKMKPLSDEDSQILFHRRIFQSKEKCPEDLQVVSREILKKCGGVPLAIITIASLLVSNQRIKQKDEWMHVQNSMGRGVTQGGIAKDMKRILALSYYDLPHHLKPCLLYLSIFPEDYEIQREWLIWRWINSRSLPHLSSLQIDVEELQGGDIQIIGMLPALRFLCLRASRVMGTLVVRADAFPSAICCKFYGFPMLPCLFPPGAMPRLQRLQFMVSVWSIASGEVDCGLGHLPSLEQVWVDLHHENSSNEEIETAMAWLRRAAEAHPKRPAIEFIVL